MRHIFSPVFDLQILAFCRAAKTPVMRLMCINFISGILDFSTFTVMALFAANALETGTTSSLTLSFAEFQVAISIYSLVAIVAIRICFVSYGRHYTYISIQKSSEFISQKLFSKCWFEGRGDVDKLVYQRVLSQGWVTWLPGAFSAVSNFWYEIGVLCSLFVVAMVMLSGIQFLVLFVLVISFTFVFYLFSMNTSDLKVKRAEVEESRERYIDFCSYGGGWAFPIFVFNLLNRKFLNISRDLFYIFYRYELLKKYFKIGFELLAFSLFLVVVTILDENALLFALLGLRVFPSASILINEMKSWIHFKSNVNEVLALLVPMTEGQLAFGESCLEYEDKMKRFLGNTEYGVLVIHGPSGSGKTVALKRIFSESKHLSNVCYIPQTPFNASISVQEFVELSGIDPDDFFIWQCEQFKLDYESLKHTNVNKLSGGERIRLIFVFVVCKDFCIVLLDEPTTGLDKENRTAIIDAIEVLSSRCSIVAVSHDDSLVKKFGND